MKKLFYLTKVLSKHVDDVTAPNLIRRALQQNLKDLGLWSERVALFRFISITFIEESYPLWGGSVLYYRCLVLVGVGQKDGCKNINGEPLIGTNL